MNRKELKEAILKIMEEEKSVDYADEFAYKEMDEEAATDRIIDIIQTLCPDLDLGRAK